MKGKRRKFFKDLVVFFGGPKSQTDSCPKPSPTASVDMYDEPCCCAATHELVRGTGRHLAAHPADVPDELPQAYRRGYEEHTRFRINGLITTILMEQCGTR